MSRFSASTRRRSLARRSSFPPHIALSSDLLLGEVLLWSRGVEDDHHQYQQQIGDQGNPPEHALPAQQAQVSQRHVTNEEASQGAGQVRRVGHLVARLGAVPVVDGHADVGAGEQQQERQPHERQLHFGPVQDQVGEVGGDERVHAPGGSGQEHARVEHRRSQRPGEDARHVHDADPPPLVNQLQRQADDQLDEEVVRGVHPADVHQHVGDEPPDLAAPVRVIDERRLGVHGAAAGDASQPYAVVDEEGHLDGGQQRYDDRRRGAVVLTQIARRTTAAGHDTLTGGVQKSLVAVSAGVAQLRVDPGAAALAHGGCPVDGAVQRGQAGHGRRLAVPVGGDEQTGHSPPRSLSGQWRQIRGHADGDENWRQLDKRSLVRERSAPDVAHQFLLHDAVSPQRLHSE